MTYAFYEDLQVCMVKQLIDVHKLAEQSISFSVNKCCSSKSR